MPGPKPQRLQFQSKDGDIAEVVPTPGFNEKPGVPVGTTAAERQKNVATFDSAGRMTSPGQPNRITPAPAPERLERKEISLAPVTPVPGGYDSRFPAGESALGCVPNPGLQPGERPGDPPIPRGT